MIRSADEIIRRARSLVGVRFRPQGRDPQTGLDCVGVILCAFGLSADEVRKNYRLRGQHLQELLSELSRHFRRIAVSASSGADVLVCSPSDDQFHLAVSCGESFVHADSRLRRVAETPGRPLWPCVATFRRRHSENQSS